MIEVSVVIPARDVADVISLQLDALARQQTDRSWEVIVADNGSCDGTGAVAKRAIQHFPVSLRVVDASRRAGINVARNDGIAAARGTKILLCDADDTVSARWVDELARGLDAFPLVGGSLEFTTLNATSGPAWALRGESGLRRFREFWFPIGANFGVRREVVDALGGFDEAFVLGYCETDFAYRAHCSGLAIGFIPEAIVHYRLRGTLRSIMKQRYRYGRGQALLLTKHSDLVDPRHDRAGRHARGCAKLLLRVAKHNVRRPEVTRLLLVELAHEIGLLQELVRARRPLGASTPCVLDARPAA